MTKEEKAAADKAAFFALYTDQPVVKHKNELFSLHGVITRTIDIRTETGELINVRKGELIVIGDFSGTGYVQGSTLQIEECYLELTDLRNITDEHAIAISDILGVEYSAYNENAHFDQEGFADFIEALFNEVPGSYIDCYDASKVTQVIDYLRQHSYAIRFRSYSVEDLVRMGWVKIKEQ